MRKDKESSDEKIIGTDFAGTLSKNNQRSIEQRNLYSTFILTKEKMKGAKRNEGKKKLYYISAEFLIGKLLSNNLINLGLFEETKEVLEKHGHQITEIEKIEQEPSGNGDWDVFAACF